MRRKHSTYAFYSGIVFFIFLLSIAFYLLSSSTAVASLSTVGQGGGRPTTTSVPKKTTKPKPTRKPNRNTRPSGTQSTALPPPARTRPTETAPSNSNRVQQILDAASAMGLLQCEAQSPTSGTGREYAEDLNGVKLVMVEIPAGSFCMGSPPSEVGRFEDEGPQHRVTVQGFWMGKYEVTQEQWQAVMGVNPSEFIGDNLPVENISWMDAVEFCRKLSQMTGRKYRLPSEAEWEYAARAGTTTPFAFGASLSSGQANFDGNYPYGGAPKRLYRQQPISVDSFSPNNFGLHNMHGNVWEWCQDRFHGNYIGAPTDGSAWESGGVEYYRIMRGGSWVSLASHLRSAYRDTTSRLAGLRVVTVDNFHFNLK